MFGMLKSFEESARLDHLKQFFNTAKKLGKKECQKCGFCCHTRTCIPLPNELVEIAKYLNLSVIDTIKTYYCIDSQGNGVFYVKPAGINQLDILGKYIPDNRTYNEGACIFLTNENQCKIYPVRPNQAKTQECWNNSVQDNTIVQEVWKGDKLKELYPMFKIDEVVK